jgi:hypothetical protein
MRNRIVGAAVFILIVALAKCSVASKPAPSGPFVQCTLIGQTFYKSDPPPEFPQKPLLIYRCSRADGSEQTVYSLP